MPQIPEFTATSPGITAPEGGVEARAMAGRRLGAFYHQTGEELSSAFAGAAREAQQFVDHQEISHGAVAYAGLMGDLTDQWNEIAKNADPNDPTVAGRFRAAMEDKLDDFANSFHTPRGQEWAEARVDALRNHLWDKTAADMSTIAGVAAETNVRRITSSLSNTAREDPSSIDHMLEPGGTIDSSVGAVVDSSNLKGAEAAKVKQTLVQRAKEEAAKAAGLGIAEKSSDPENAVIAFGQRHGEYVDAQTLDQFAKAARMYRRMNDAEDRQARQQQDYENRNDFNKQVNQLEASTIPEKVGDRPTLPSDYWQRLKDLSTHPGAALEPGRLRTMVTNGEAITERLNKPEPMGRLSHDTTMDLLGRIRATDDTRLQDNGAIYQAYRAGKLNNADFNFLTKEFADTRTPEGQQLAETRKDFFNRYAGKIDAAMDDPNSMTPGKHSELGNQQMYKAEMDARRQEQQLRAKGQDPMSLYDPSSPNFFGRPENIVKYRATMQDILNDQNAHKGEGANLTAPGGRGLTGPGETITGAQVINQPPGAKPFVPPANWEWSPSRQQYRDRAGQVYDVTGKPVTATQEGK